MIHNQKQKMLKLKSGIISFKYFINKSLFGGLLTFLKLVQSEEPNPDADSDFANSSDDDADDAVKHDPDKDIKNESDVKVDPDNDQTVKTEKLETGQRHDETLEEFKQR